MNDVSFQAFPKMARLSRQCIITEKIDGTNAQILIAPTKDIIIPLGGGAGAVYYDLGENGMTVFAGSRNRWIIPGDDNFGFAAWVSDNIPELLKLGPGRHFGEWWGGGIQRGYALNEKRFSLFNVSRWQPVAASPGSDTYREREINKQYFDGVLQYLPHPEMPPDSNLVDVAGPRCVSTVPVLAVGEFSTAFAEETLINLRRTGSQASPGFMDPEGIVVWHIAAGAGFKKTIKGDESRKSISRE